MSLHRIDNLWRRRLAGWGLAATACLPLAVHGQPGGAASASAREPVRTAVASPAGKPVGAAPRGQTAPARASSAGAGVSSQAAAAEVDPNSLDAIRDRLAARLGSRKSTDPKVPNVVRIATRAPGEFQVSTAAGRARGAATGRTAAEAPADAEASAGAGWAHEGPRGPEAWSRLKPEYAACGQGRRQSPIDIRDAIRVDLEPIQFDYRASGFTVIDTGHTIQVRLAPGNSLEVRGRRYELRHLEFRHPGEERIEGRGFAMSVHLTHQDAEGRLAVLAVPLEPGEADPPHPVLQAAWNNLPLDKGEEVPARTTLDPAALLPQDRRYHTYMGSMTVPPCSEGVLWMVMEQPVRVTPAQIAIFARLYPMNARPLQAAAGRLIKGSN